jgi:hypothetical protein
VQGRIGRSVVVSLVLALAAVSAARAQEFEPRTYAFTPVGLNFLALGYGFSTGALFMDPALPVEDIDADVHVVATRYVRTFALFERPGRLKLSLPWSSGHWEGLVEGAFRTRDTAGLGDARIALETLFGGGRARTPEEMQGYVPGTVWGGRLELVVPTGDYDSGRAINLGSHRWAVVPEVGFGHPIGAWSIEGAVGASFYGDNDDFFGGRRLEQDPLLAGKLHAIRSIRPGFWWAIAAGYGYGGRTTVDDVERDTLQRNWRLALVLAYPIRRDQGISVLLGSGGSSSVGSDYDSLSVGYQLAF